jgi:uncharacterized peroxidase-related enzyme
MMTQFVAGDPATATGAAKAAFDEASVQFGGVINLFRMAGNAPNVLSGVLAMNRALGDDLSLTNRQVELVAMLVSALNHCDYCVNVHMQVGKGQGVAEADMLAAMAGHATSAADQALLDYTNDVVRRRGLVRPDVLDAARQAGLSNKALLEVIGVIGVYTTLQYIRHVTNPAHDFPVVESYRSDKHGATI